MRTAHNEIMKTNNNVFIICDKKHKCRRDHRRRGKYFSWVGLTVFRPNNTQSSLFLVFCLAIAYIEFVTSVISGTGTVTSGTHSTTHSTLFFPPDPFWFSSLVFTFMAFSLSFFSLSLVSSCSLYWIANLRHQMFWGWVQSHDSCVKLGFEPSY